MSSAARRFALQQLERTTPVPEMPLATVTAVTAAGASDGNALVTVNYLGASLQFPYVDSYTPVVGHRVALIRMGGTWTIFGRPVGFPAS